LAYDDLFYLFVLRREKMKKVLFVVFLLTVSATIVFAGLSDNVSVAIMGNPSFVEVRNYNDVPVTVSITIEYRDGDVIRFEQASVSLGRKGFSSDTKHWTAPRGTYILSVDIKSVR
jgi:hypothetical protein